MSIKSDHLSHSRKVREGLRAQLSQGVATAWKLNSKIWLASNSCLLITCLEGERWFGLRDWDWTCPRRTNQPRQKQNCIGPAASCTWVCTLACMQKLGGSGDMLPQENFLNLMFWDDFWGYFGTQNITTNLCMVPEFWFTSRLHAWRWVSIGSFKPPENDVMVRRTQAG